MSKLPYTYNVLDGLYGCYGYRFGPSGEMIRTNIPGYVKRYERRIKRLRKTKSRRRDRQTGKNELRGMIDEIHEGGVGV